MALNSVAHPSAIAGILDATWWEDEKRLEISASHDDTVLLTIDDVGSRAEARDVLNRALGALGQYVVLSD